MIRPTLFLFICLICFSGLSGQDIETNKEGLNRGDTPPENPRYCVLFHSPGPNWKEGLTFQEQPGVMEHVKYMRQQWQEGLMVMGGPFLDDSGGMMIFSDADIEKARLIASADPAVKSGLLTVTVKLWMVPMSSVQKIPDRIKQH
jgi:uncharacterized protein YciI